MGFIRFAVALIAAAVVLLISIPLLIAAAPFMLVAAGTRWLAARREPPAGGWEELIEFDASLGWRPRPNLNQHYVTVSGDAVCHVRTGADGWPESAPWAPSDIVVFGDSYAFGYGVDTKDSFATIGPGRVKTLGAPGYNLAQEALLMDEVSTHLAGKTVVWWIYLGNDLLDNLLPAPIGYRTPFMRQGPDGAWQLVTDHVRPERWTVTRHPDYNQALAELCTSSFLATRAYGAVGALLGRGKAVCDRVGARLVIMTIPSVAQLTDEGAAMLRSHLDGGQVLDPDLPDKKIAASCAELDLEFVAAKRFLNPGHYKPGDPHWNLAGHREMARLLDRIERGDPALTVREGVSPGAAERSEDANAIEEERALKA